MKTRFSLIFLAVVALLVLVFTFDLPTAKAELKKGAKPDAGKLFVKL